ncbi:MAG: hypothetical protein IPG64_24965 [Haliea sp.]|nr:hypothetical protein [Haliea sp.]
MPTTGFMLRLSYAYLDVNLDDVFNTLTNEIEPASFGPGAENTFSVIVGYVSTPPRSGSSTPMRVTTTSMIGTRTAGSPTAIPTT